MNSKDENVTDSSKYVSSISTSFFHSIARLCESLLHCIERNAVACFNEISPRHDENAYCISICILAVASVESAILRTCHIEEGPEFNSNKPFFWLAEKLPREKNKINELAFIRGSLLHNHLYEMEQVWKDDKPTIQNIQKRPASGDNKYDQNVNSCTHKTIQLGINAIPTQVRLADVILVLCAVTDLLFALEDRSKGKLAFRSVRVELNSTRSLTILDLINTLRSRLETYDPVYKNTDQ